MVSDPVHLTYDIFAAPISWTWSTVQEISGRGSLVCVPTSGGGEVSSVAENVHFAPFSNSFANTGPVAAGGVAEPVPVGVVVVAVDAPGPHAARITKAIALIAGSV